MTLTNKTVSSTYKSLLRVTDAQNSAARMADDLQPMVDGDGTILPIAITARTGGAGSQSVLTPPDAENGARINLGTLPGQAETATLTIKASAEEIEFYGEQAIEVGSNDEIDMFGLAKFGMSGVLQLSGTRTDDSATFQGEGAPTNVYTRHKAPEGDPALGVLPEAVSYGSMKEFGGYTEVNEGLRTIDFAGSIKPQYDNIYTLGDSSRSLLGLYVGCVGDGVELTSPDSMAAGIKLKIGDTVIDDQQAPVEDVCNLTINSATSALTYNNPGNTSAHVDSSNGVVVKNLELLTRVASMPGQVNMSDTLVTEIEAAAAASSQNTQYVLNNQSNAGDMKIVVVRQHASDNSNITITDGSNTIATISTAGSSKLDYTFIKISTGWIQINQ